MICFVDLALGRAIEMACGHSLRSAMDALWKVTDGELLDTTTGEVFTLREEIPQETKDLLKALGLSY